jgi:hypothetical protein
VASPKKSNLICLIYVHTLRVDVVKTDTTEQKRNVKKRKEKKRKGKKRKEKKSFCRCLKPEGKIKWAARESERRQCFVLFFVSLFILFCFVLLTFLCLSLLIYWKMSLLVNTWSCCISVKT